MKRLIVALVLLPALAAAERPDPIDRVVVYGDRAQVTRKATVACTGGEATATFFPLPMTLQPRTLRAAAAGEATAVGTTARERNIDAEADARVAPLRAELKRTDAALRVIADRQQLHAAARQDSAEFKGYLQQVLNEALRARRPALKQWGQALDTFHKESITRVDAQNALAQEAAELHKARARTQRRINLLQAGSGEAAWTVDVAVDCGGASQATVRLSYVVPGATWKPEYDLRFQTNNNARAGKGTVELGVGAVIQQSSGEDWHDVTLVLSSARPWLGVEAMRPRPMRIAGQKGSEQKKLVQAKERRETLSVSADQAPQEAPAGAQLDDGGQSITLTLPHKARIASDGRPYWVPVDVRRTKGTSRLVAVPQKTQYVYQLVKFDNPAPYPLMAGRLHTWRNGTFVGDTHLRHRGPNAPVEASLGIDESFRVERVTVKDSTQKPGLLSSTVKLPRLYAITVHNRTRSKATVEVRESIPVSKIDDVKVVVLKKKTTKGFEHDAVRGMMTWSTTVKANSQQEVTLGYRINLPEDWKM
jgi:uncharacterized protein (TIGR02231 family)